MLLAVLLFSTAWVVLVVLDVLGTVWLVAGPALTGATEIVVSHMDFGHGQPAEAGEDAPGPVPSPY